MLEIEKKWQKIWTGRDTHTFKPDAKKQKFYVLEMFSYPSGAKLHAGHWFNYGPSDSFARFKKMQGYNVFQPMGFDAFGLPAENYAIKTGIHPQDSTDKNIAAMESQLSAMGAMFDWTAGVVTCRPEYYKWNQWLFLELYKNNLAYRKEAPVNWCGSCNTVLANEQVIDGYCERCDTQIIRKNLTQWFFKITDYAEELLNKIDSLDWPEKTKLMQKNWIGKSTGGEIEFSLITAGGSEPQRFKVFTTRADTLFGVSYVVLAPEHPLVDIITTKDYKKSVDKYKADVSKINEIDRLSSTAEKTGVFTGAYAVNPISNQVVPVWIADYVLLSYGTGAVMGVPAHDERDFEFAAKHKLPVTRVIEGGELPYTQDGKMINSGEFNGMDSTAGRLAVIKKLSGTGKGELKTNYRLRDWLVSRQRYWGTPIPVIHCDKCGAVPVPEKDLPVLLPYDVDFTPDGKSPLLKHDGFMNTTCPVCNSPAKRDPDTLDTFVCSSWYYLRYADSKNEKCAFDKDKIDRMLPVDKYIGGAEHACMHLLYARFITKALRDMGYLDFDEPFTSLIHQGIILGTDGFKMSKSRGNVVSPDESIFLYGSDVFRMYLMFGFSYIEGGPWNDEGIKSMAKFLERLERVVLTVPSGSGNQQEDSELNFMRNSTIARVTADMEIFSFNTAIARIMELVNSMSKYNGGNTGLYKSAAYDLVRLIAPLAPHLAEELNGQLGNKDSIFEAPYPVADKNSLVRDNVELAVQVNSKMKGKITVSSRASEADIRAAAEALPSVKEIIGNMKINKIIVIKGRLVNIVAN